MRLYPLLLVFAFAALAGSDALLEMQIRSLRIQCCTSGILTGDFPSENPLYISGAIPLRLSKDGAVLPLNPPTLSLKSPVIDGSGSLHGYAVADPVKLAQLRIDIDNLMGIRGSTNPDLNIVCAGNCGSLVDQLEGLRGTTVSDIPFANPGLWVSPANNPYAVDLAKLLSGATGRKVQIDTLQDTPDGILSSKVLTIVVSKELRHDP